MVDRNRDDDLQPVRAPAVEPGPDPVLRPFLMIGAWPLIMGAFTRPFDAPWA